MESVQSFFLLFLFPILALAGETPYPPAADGPVTFGQNPSYPSGIWADEHPGYAVQAGYEGYLVPAESLGIKDIIKTAGFVAAIPFLAKVAVKLVLKAGLAVLALGAVVSVGVVLTYLLCACTPVCKLTFHKFDKWHKWDRDSMRSLINTDSINSAADFLSTAITKYNEVGKKPATD